MLLSDIINEVLTESGQFFFLEDGIEDPLACFGWTTARFWNNLVKRQLDYYSRFRPLTFTFNREAFSAGHLGQAVVVFGADSTEQPGDFDANNVFDSRVGVFNRDPLRVPEWISSVIPTQTLSTVGIQYLFQVSSLINTGEQSRLHEPRTYLYKYERDDNHGMLYVTEIGIVEITAHYKFWYEEIYNDDNVLTDVDIFYLDTYKDHLFIDLITAYFMIAVGRSRRITLEGNPVQFDSQELIQEGREMLEDVKRRIEETSLWWLSAGI